MAFQNFPFPIDQERTGISLAYSNKRYIADEVSPRVGVASPEFKWLLRNRDEAFTVPETMVGRTSQPNEVQFGGSDQTGFVRDYGLDDLVPNDDIEKAPAGFDPLGTAVEGLTDLVALDREQRVATLYFTASNYPAANRATLSGTSQWSDFANSDPYTAINTARDGMLMPPNIGVIGRQAWSRLKVHPKITAALAPSSTGNTLTSNGAGAPATLQAVAELLELDRILVGEAWINSAKPGQTASLVRVWGKHMALLHQNPIGSTTNGKVITFGYTAEFGNRVSGSIPEPKIGLRGSQRVRVGESVNEIIAASDVGYLFSNVVA
jgi:hypothetical protein